MVKQRMTLVDVIAMVQEMNNTVVGRRVVNIYDLDARTYVFKLQKSGGEKSQLLIESGVRLHTTRYERDRAGSAMPSSFCAKLRKHLRNTRVSWIRQLGTDRVVDIVFGSGPATHHVILELYASGNIILTDAAYSILMVLRRHKYGEDARVAVGQVYPIAHATNVGMNVAIAATAAGGATAAAAGDDDHDEPVAALDAEAAAAEETAAAATVLAGSEDTALDAPADTEAHNTTPTTSVVLTQAAVEDWINAAGQLVLKGKEKSKANLKQVLSNKGSPVDVLGPLLIEHAIVQAGLDPSLKVSAGWAGLTIDQYAALFRSLSELPALLESLSTTPPQGFVVLGAPADVQESKDINDVKPLPDTAVLEDFVPRLFAQFQPPYVDARCVVQFPTFGAAVDEYFARMEADKASKEENAANTLVERKVARFKAEHEKKILALRQQQAASVRAARLIELHASDVDKAILVVRSGLDGGISWEALERHVAEATAAGNPIASMVQSMNLKEHQITLKLAVPSHWDSDSDDSGSEKDGSDDEDDDDKSSEDDTTASTKSRKPFANVTVDVRLSAHANATSHYGSGKDARQKESKTESAAEGALKTTAKRAQTSQDKQQKALRAGIRVARKPFWFERFNWFITTDNVIVVAGMDAQQNEQLVKRYLRKQDVYVHADLSGAASCIVRNPSTDPESADSISVTALEQAGIFSVCHSVAWDAATPASAWWVYSHQVSKTPQSGEYVTTGSFIIRGKRNPLPPVKLEMGLALLWKIDEACLASRAPERVTDTHAAGGAHHPAAGRGDNEVDAQVVLQEDDAQSTPDAAEAEDQTAQDSDQEEDATNAAAPAAPAAPAAEPSAEASDSGSDAEEAPAAAAEAAAPAEPVTVTAAAPAPSAGGKQKKGGNQQQQQNKGKGKPQQASKATSTNKSDGGYKRGQRFRQKKMQDKYADQDDDERYLALRALGHNVPAPGKAAGSAAVAEAAPAPAPAPAAPATAAVLAALASLPPPPPKQPTKERQTSLDEDVAVVEPDAVVGDAAALATLIGMPQDGDVLLHCVPMCAPYRALQSYKYKLKIQPGQLKKGKAVKQALGMFLNWSQCLGVEKELLKTVPEQELVRVMMSNCRVVPPGASTSAAASKGKGKHGGGKSHGKKHHD